MTDPRVLVIINWEGSGPRRLATWLEDEGVTPVVVEGKDGLPESIEGYSGLVMLGGGLMPDNFEKAPWLRTERELARQAIDADLPTLGICLGGQLIADVAGGEVRENFGPPERGSFEITPNEAGRADAVLGHLGDVSPMIQHHRDMITRIPASAQLLASSELIENQAFKIGSHVRGLQFHPEASVENVRNWNPESLAEHGVDHAEILAKAEADDAANTSAAEAMVKAFAAEIRAYAYN